MALVVIVLTIVGVAIGRLPRLRMNRATIALVGATVLVAIGAISLEEAYRSIDLDTIVLLLAMMIVNANLRLAGFFRFIANWLLHRSGNPRRLLLILMLASGLLSAVFLNDTIVVIMTPLVLEVVLELELNPMPFLVGLATSANIGSVGAITGNPQNMLIGTSSGISYVRFSAHLMPLAIVCLFVAWGILLVIYRKDLSCLTVRTAHAVTVRTYRPLLQKGIAAVVVLLVLLVSGVAIPLAALIAASILLVTRRLKPERVFQEVDWSLLVFFAGLFVVTGAVETSGWSEEAFRVLLPVAHGGIFSFSAVAVVLSNLISNVPAVLLFRPFVPQFPDPERVWLVLAMATTFAGNLTLLGSVANLIVAESAARRRVRLSFGEYLKAGVPITLATVILGAIWLGLLT